MRRMPPWGARSRPARALLLAAASSLAVSPRPAAGAGVDVSNSRATVVCVERDPLVNSRRAAGCSGWASRAGSRVLMSYNRLGLRDKDYPARPEAGTLRVLLIGGSLMTAPGLDEASSPPRAFERSLRAAGLKAEVVNASGEGYVGWQNVVRLKEYLDAYSPQAVVYHLAAHYVFADMAQWPDLRFAGEEIAGAKPALRFVPARLRPFFQKHPLLPFMIRTERDEWNRVLASRRLSREADPARRLDALLEPTLRELEQMERLSRASGARFYVAYDGDEVNADQYMLVRGAYAVARLAQWLCVRSFSYDGAEIERRLEADAARSGYRVLSLSRALPALKDPADRLPRDYHWNARGAEIFAKAAAVEFLKDRTERPSGAARRGGAR